MLVEEDKEREGQERVECGRMGGSLVWGAGSMLVRRGDWERGREWAEGLAHGVGPRLQLEPRGRRNGRRSGSGGRGREQK